MSERNDIDIVYISSPTIYHYEMVRSALEMGKNVLCEKSMGITANQVSQLVSITKKQIAFLWEDPGLGFSPHLYSEKMD